MLQNWAFSRIAVSMSLSISIRFFSSIDRWCKLIQVDMGRRQRISLNLSMAILSWIKQYAFFFFQKNILFGLKKRKWGRKQKPPFLLCSSWGKGWNGHDYADPVICDYKLSTYSLGPTDSKKICLDFSFAFLRSTRLLWTYIILLVF